MGKANDCGSKINWGYRSISKGVASGDRGSKGGKLNPENPNK